VDVRDGGGAPDADGGGRVGHAGRARGARRSHCRAPRGLIVARLQLFLLFLFLFLFLGAAARRRDGAWASQPDRPAEALELDFRAAVAEGVGRAPAATHLAHGLGRQVAVEVAVVGSHAEGRVGGLRHDHRDVAVVRRHPVGAARADRAFVPDVAVHRTDVQTPRVDLAEHDVPVGRFRGDVAGPARDPDPLVDRARVDAALRVLEDDLAFDRLGRDEPRSTLDDDVAADGLGRDLVLRAFDADVQELSAHFHRKPDRRRDFVVDAAHRAA